MRVNFDDGAGAAPTEVLATPLNQTIGYNASGVVTTAVTIADPDENGASLKYQWYKALSATSYMGATPLAGETAATLSPATSAEGTSYYYVLVSNSKAPAGIVSNIVTVTVGATSVPSVSVVPNAAQEVDEGTPTTQLSANVNTGGAAPSSVTYQWYSRATDSNAIAGATLISGATTTTFTPPSNNAGILYYFCVATNAKGSSASNTIKVEIKYVIKVGSILTIDSIAWRVLTIDKTTVGGPYYLITTDRAVAGTSVYNPGTAYIAYANQTTGGVRAAVNNWYALRGDELKSRACLPTTLASETAHNTVQPAAMTATNGWAAGSATADVAFLLSWSEVSTYLPTAAARVLRNTSNTAVAWWLRSPGSNSAFAGNVNASGTLSIDGVANSYSLRPALWIK